MVKNLQDRLSTLEFEFPRVRGLVDEILTMLLHSMSRDLKVLRGELSEAIARNNGLGERVEEIMRELHDVRAEVDGMKGQTKRESDEHDDIEVKQERNSILSVSHTIQRPGLALTENGVRTTSDDYTEYDI